MPSWLRNLPNLTSEKDLRKLLRALERWGFSIVDVPRPEVRERLRALQGREGGRPDAS